MIVNSKAQRSNEKVTHRDTRNKQLPILHPQVMLEPHQCPVIYGTIEYSRPLDLNSIKLRLKSSEESSNQTKIRAQKSIIKTNTNALSENQTNILMKLVLTSAQLQRVSEQRQFELEQEHQILVWKQKYEDILRRYKQGESSFYKLAERNKQLENQLKFPVQTIDQSIIKSKQIEIKNLKDQLKTARDVSQRNIDLLQSSNRRLQNQRNQIRQLLQSANSQKSRLQNQQSFIKTQNFNQQSDFQKLNNDLVLTRQQIQKIQEQNRRLIQSISKLTEQLTIKQRQYQDDLSRQIFQYKQNASTYLNECQRLTDEVTRLNEKAAKEHNNQRIKAEMQIGLKQQIIRLKSKIQGLQKLKDDAVQSKNELTHARIKNQGLQRQINHLRQNNKTYSDKIYELEMQIRKLDHTKLQNSQIRLNYESIKRQVDQVTISSEVQKSQLINKNKILQKDIEFYKIQDRSKDQLIEKLNKENSQFQKQILNNQDADLLKKHLQLSVDQIQKMYSYTKSIITELMGRLSWLSKQKDQLLKKQQYQEFELEKLYEVLKTRKQQLENCYKTIDNLRKGTDDKQPSQDLNQILRNRREQLL